MIVNSHKMSKKQNKNKDKSNHYRFRVMDIIHRVIKGGEIVGVQ